jgi:hypothetical protein
MRKRVWLGAVVTALFLAGTALHAAAEKATVSGEVIDSACYAKNGAKGPDHAACAQRCAKNGVPLAILTDDGQVVMVASPKEGESGNALLVDHVAKKVTVEGTWSEKEGKKVLVIDKVMSQTK